VARIICLANSRKHGNRCVAGLDQATGRLVRPVTLRGDGAIPPAMERLEGGDPQVLDVLDLPLGAAGPDYGFQPENRLLAGGPWARVGRADPKTLLPFCENTPTLLHNGDDRVPWTFLHGLPRPQWKSLQLVHVTGVRFSHRLTRKGLSQVRVRFCFRGVVYDVSVTDPAAEEAVLARRPMATECVLLVSLGEPFPEGAPDRHCYKLAAGVVAMPP
jgi:hypothetical protein